jgi:hypothetical protein
VVAAPIQLEVDPEVLGTYARRQLAAQSRAEGIQSIRLRSPCDSGFSRRDVAGTNRLDVIVAGDRTGGSSDASESITRMGCLTDLRLGQALRSRGQELENRISFVSDLLPALITTLGTLAGSFGGYTLAARTQGKQSDRDDARALRDADRARFVALEDERHEFQLKTLVALQELVRLKARSTILVIEQDRRSILSGQGYRLLPADDPKDFADAIEFGHNVARVTAPELRARLESFRSLSGEYSMPPQNWNHLSQEDALAIQERRFVSLAEVANQTTMLLGEYLRREIDRHTTA